MCMACTTLWDKFNKNFEPKRFIIFNIFLHKPIFIFNKETLSAKKKFHKSFIEGVTTHLFQTQISLQWYVCFQ